MATDAGDAGMRRGVVHVVEVGIVEAAAKQGYRVVASRAEACGVDVAVPDQDGLAGIAHREQVRGIVERSEPVRAVLPLGMGVRMAVRAFLVAHQLRRDDVATRGGARQGGLEVRFGTGVGFAGLGNPQAQNAHDNAECADAQPCRPPDAPSGEAMQHEQPADQHRRPDVRPVRHGPQRRIAQLDERNAAGQPEPGGEQHDDAAEQRESETHGQAVGAPDGAAQVHDAVDQHRERDPDAEQQVPEEHREIDRVFQARAGQPLAIGDGTEIGRVEHQQGEQDQYREQQLAHAGTNDRNGPGDWLIGHSSVVRTRLPAGKRVL